MNDGMALAPFALAQVALVELWRNRLVFLPIAVALLLGLGMYLAPVQAAPTISGMREWGLAIEMLPSIGQVLGVLAGCAMIAAEVERGTAALLVTRQPRWVIVLGKFLGAAAFVIAAFALWALVFVGSGLYQGVHEGLLQIAVATLLGALPGLLMVAVALAFSTRATSYVAVGGVAMLFMVKGIANTMLLGQMLSKAPIAHALAHGLVYALPTDWLGEIAKLAAQGHPLASGHQLALLSIPAWLALAVALFARRDLSR